MAKRSQEGRVVEGVLVQGVDGTWYEETKDGRRKVEASGRTSTTRGENFTRETRPRPKD